MTDLHSPPTRDIDTPNLSQKVPPSIPPRPPPHAEALNRTMSEQSSTLPTHREAGFSAEEDSLGKVANSSNNRK